MVRPGVAGVAVLTILSVAYPFAPVGPDAVGGAEQVLSALDHALVAAGHRSLVVAREGSVVAGSLLPVRGITSGEIDATGRAAVHADVQRIVAAAAEGADLVHLHGLDFDAYLQPPGPPALITLHLPPAWYPGSALAPRRPRTWFNCVSSSQQRACPRGTSMVPTIPNGVPVEALGAARHACRGYAVMLGRICPEKGQHLALQAAHAAGVTLLLGGEVYGYKEHRAYFEDDVRPLLDARRRYLGPVGFARKRRLLAAARCLLVPSLAAETSSLVTMEALACGTPVIAFPAGALPEIVENGRTGFLVEGVERMAAAIHEASAIDRALCRQTAIDRFSARRMTDAYLALYQRLATCS
jgi:glycosyltransferase involved in cell wall biosynthesis